MNTAAVCPKLVWLDRFSVRLMQSTPNLPAFEAWQLAVLAYDDACLRDPEDAATLFARGLRDSTMPGLPEPAVIAAIVRANAAQSALQPAVATV